MRVLLIGGSSHIGKSTVAGSLARRLGWDVTSTDSLARHPGRPWRVGDREVPAHVDEHYSSLAVEELLIDVLAHYRRLWSGIQAIITKRMQDGASAGLILEGSALWPESVAELNLEALRAVWLTGSDDLFRNRIYRGSGFERASPHERLLIQQFLDRTILYNERMMAVINRLGLTSIKVEEHDAPQELSERILALSGGVP